MVKKKDDWLNVVIEEYNTLRTECLSSMQTQQSVLRFGLATVMVLVAVGVRSREDTFLAGVLFLFFLPITSYLILSIWMGEVTRMMRAGFFVMKIEKKVNSLFVDLEPPLNWENWLREGTYIKGKPQMKSNYIAIILLFLSIAFTSVVLGNQVVWQPFSFEVGSNAFWCVIKSANFLLVNVFEIIAFVIVFLYLYRTGKSFV